MWQQWQRTLGRVHKEMASWHRGGPCSPAGHGGSNVNEHLSAHRHRVAPGARRRLNGGEEIARDLPDWAGAHDDDQVAVTTHHVQMLDDGVKGVQVHGRDAAF